MATNSNYPTTQSMTFEMLFQSTATNDLLPLVYTMWPATLSAWLSLSTSSTNTLHQRTSLQLLSELSYGHSTHLYKVFSALVCGSWLTSVVINHSRRQKSSTTLLDGFSILLSSSRTFPGRFLTVNTTKLLETWSATWSSSQRLVRNTPRELENWCMNCLS